MFIALSIANASLLREIITLVSYFLITFWVAIPLSVKYRYFPHEFIGKNMLPTLTIVFTDLTSQTLCLLAY